MSRKKSPPWIYPDKIVKGEDGVSEIWLLYGFESEHGLFPIGTMMLPEDRENVIAQKRNLARGKHAQP